MPYRPVSKTASIGLKTVSSTFAVPAAIPLGIDAAAPENRLGCFVFSVGGCAIPCRFTSSTWRCSSPEYSDSQFDII